MKSSYGIAVLGVCAVSVCFLGAIGAAAFQAKRKTSVTKATLPKDSSIAVVDLGNAQYESFDGCGLSGSLTDPTDRKYQTNLLKNRYVAPLTAAQVDLAAMLQASTGSTAFSESDGATVQGILAKVILEKGESCNCGKLGEGHADEHIYLVANQSDYQHFRSTGDKSRVVNVELTPRTKRLAAQNGFTWNAKTLASLIGHKVAISGWLLDDWEHADVSAADGATARIDRGTVWEIHPVTRIQVLN